MLSKLRVTGTHRRMKEKMRSPIVSIVGAILCVTLLASAVTARPLGDEAQAVLDIILASPVIKPEAGFSARMLIPPGELYDPLFMRPHGSQVWMNDDGRATDGHGSRLLAITPQGGIRVLMGADKLLLVTSFDRGDLKLNLHSARAQLSPEEFPCECAFDEVGQRN